MTKFTRLNAIEKKRGKMGNINELINDIHRNAVNHGWWEEEKSRAEIFALIHSELSEALEEYRNKKPMIYYLEEKPEGIAVELADAVIRILDYIGHKQDDTHFQYHYNYAKKPSINTEMETLPGYILCCHYYLTEAFSYEYHEWDSLEKCICKIQWFIEKNGLDLEDIIKIKHEYNKTRPYKHGGKLI